jgi:putative ABC transport system ATP-binding protein
MNPSRTRSTASDDMPAAVILENVSKSYGRGASAVAAVVELSLSFPTGEFVSVMGPSGCGKTTLLNLIAGLDTPDEGRVILAGADLASLPDDARSDMRLKCVGVVFQNFNLFPTFTVEENVAWPLEFLGVRWREARERARAMLEHVQMQPSAFGRRPGELSGGEQQRVGIARALVADPTLLLADEPTGNLDTHTGQAILDLLRALNVDRGVTVIMVTHSAFAAMYGHRTIELRDGRIVHDVRAADTPGRVVPLRP